MLANAPAQTDEQYAHAVAALRERDDIYGFDPIKVTPEMRTVLDDALQEKRARESA
jgi:hypothetical protein